jgi:zona occludens toxin
MAIMAYTGVMGSGKSYEAVATAALTAFRAGRRVVTNIAGFNYEAIRDYLGTMPDGSTLAADRVLVIASKRITEPDFFFDPDRPADTVVKPGDLVLIDEVWAFWGTDSKLSSEHQKFFRMHRHYTESISGISCDLVIMIQDLMSLHRFIRGVLESTLKCTKLKSLGLSSRYRVEIYEGNKQRKATLVSVFLRKYDKRIFPLYKSYDAGTGKENVVDNRQNLFSNRWFLLVMAASLIGLVASSVWFYRYLGHLRNPESGKKPDSLSSSSSSSPGSASGSPQSGLPSANVNSNDMRLVGLIERHGGDTIAVIQMADGRVIQHRMEAGVIDGWRSSVGYQGRFASFSSFGKAK